MAPNAIIDPETVRAEGFKPLARAATMPNKQSPSPAATPGVSPPPVSDMGSLSLLSKETNLQPFFEHIDERADLYISRLAEAVSIKSVSAWPECRPDVLRSE